MIFAIDKFNSRALESDSLPIKKRIDYLTKLNYEVLSNHKVSYFNNTPIFTIVLLIYQSDIGYIRASVNSVLRQTYNNTELILIDHGTSGDVAQFLSDVIKGNAFVKLIRVPDHEWDPTTSDFDDRVINLWNAGLFASEGDYIYNLSWDDILSHNFCQLMVNLFLENPLCTSAAPAVVSIDQYGFLNYEVSEGLMRRNQRPRFTSGLELAESYMKGGNLISFPGQLLVLKTTEVLKLGGFDRMIDLSQLFKIAIFGVSGFDPRATLKWRHHIEQGNIKQAKLGLVYYKDHFDLYANYNLGDLYDRHFDADFKIRFIEFLRYQAITSMSSSIVNSFNKFGFFSGLLSVRRAFVEAPLEVLTVFSPKIILIMARFFIQRCYFWLKSLIWHFLMFEFMRRLLSRIVLAQLKDTNCVNARGVKLGGYGLTYIERERHISPKPGRLYNLLGEISRELGSYDGIAPRTEGQRDGSVPFFYYSSSHYLLIRSIADSLSPKKVIEIGTGSGKELWAWLSSLRLQYICTYDIVSSLTDRSFSVNDSDLDCFRALIDSDSRWEQRIGDLGDPVFFGTQTRMLEDASVIFVNGPSDGVFERSLLANLLTLRNNNEIVLIFSDIRTPSMVSFWSRLIFQKIDISGIGNQLGIGLALLPSCNQRIFDLSP